MWLQGIENARAAARKFLYSAGVEHLGHVDVHAFASRLGIRIAIVPLDGALAQLVSNGRRTRLLLSDRLTDPVLRRVAIAHELAHFVMEHPPEEIERLCTPISPVTAPVDVHGPRDVEAEANAFALELLAPSCAVETLCRDAELSIELCSRFALATWVPLDYAAVRITEITERACATVVSHERRVIYAVPSRSLLNRVGDSFYRRLQSGTTLDARTLAARISERSMPCDAAEVPGSAWLDIDAATVLEDSAPWGHFGSTITVLRADAPEALALAQPRLPRSSPRSSYTINACATVPSRRVA